MKRKREVLANEDISDIPVKPSQRHSMSGEPIWDTESVRQIMNLNRLQVTFTRMPETNGTNNWTVTVSPKGSRLIDGLGFEVHRSEYWGRAQYDYDYWRFMLGEIDQEPEALDYDPDIREPEMI